MGAMERWIPALRDYLDQIGFVQLYKFIATARLYHTNPNVLSWASLERAADLESYVTGDRAALGLAACLMLKVAVPHDALSPLEQQVAGRLVDAGILVRTGGDLEMGAYQLISAQDMPLLIDSRINYPGRATQEVYFGSDSLLLAFYLDTRGVAPADRVLDLGTGAGMIGLSFARYSEHVTMTDVSLRALELAHANRLLNRMTEGVELRAERCEETLGRRERYHVVTFNPPFLPLPDGLEAPEFARGLGRDGLGYCRMLLEQLDDILLPQGTAYMVANLLGTAAGPFFTEELHRHAARHGRRIDVYIDSSIQLTAGAPAFRALGAFLHRANPEVAPAECQRRVEELQLKTLGATHAYPSVLIVRAVRDVQGARPSVRVARWTAGAPPGRPAHTIANEAQQ
jgi:tRNA1(Val) A37 N6-methylase TrmN6